MPYLTAHALDRVNEWLVRWRLAGRLPDATGSSLLEHVRELGDGFHPEPQTLGEFEPNNDGAALWRARSPWPEATGRNRDWVAERFAPAARAVSSEGAPALILLHGWLLDRPQLLFYRSWARAAARRGIEVWMPRLPHHMERTEPGEVSGQRCLSPDMVASLDAVRQGVAEARLLARWLRRAGRPRVGIWGMSLGGWTAALAATLDSDWDAVVLWAPVASPSEVLFESRLVELLRDAIVEDGLSRDEFDAAELAPSAPERSALRVPRARVLVMAGIYDQVIAPQSIVRMAHRWNVDVRWVPHGHISLMASRAPIRSTVTFLERALLSRTR